MIHVANDENYDANDVSAGVSMSRTSRSCFNSTNGPTGTTTVPPSANVSIAQPSNLETIGDEKGAQNIRVINGNLAPPNQNRRFNRTSSPPQTPSFDWKDIIIIHNREPTTLDSTTTASGFQMGSKYTANICNETSVIKYTWVGPPWCRGRALAL